MPDADRAGWRARVAVQPGIRSGAAPRLPAGEHGAAATEGASVRNISFSLTEPQLLDGSKTITRRLGWRRLKPGDRLQAVRKSMGLKRGEAIVRLCVIEIVSVRRERLDAIDADPADCAREGFPELSPGMFRNMFQKHMNCDGSTEITRIEFKRIAA
jgi:hypothetical protein